jgi:hypothetical protein
VPPKAVVDDLYSVDLNPAASHLWTSAIISSFVIRLSVCVTGADTTGHFVSVGHIASAIPETTDALRTAAHTKTIVFSLIPISPVSIIFSLIVTHDKRSEILVAFCLPDKQRSGE